MRAPARLFYLVSTSFLGLMHSSCAGSIEPRTTQLLTAVRAGQFTQALALYEHSGHKPDDLRVWAQAVLLSAAQSSERAQSRAGLQELTTLGRRALPVLESLSLDDQASAVLVRAKALSLRMALGESDARAELLALLDHADAEVVDIAYGALDPDSDDDRARLVQALQSPRVKRRAVALHLLALDASRPGTAGLLLQVSKHDPEATLRAAGLRALLHYHGTAREPCEQALADRDEQVRVVALTCLTQQAPEAALSYLDEQLGAASSSVSIAAASLWLRMRPARDPGRARAALLAALTSADVGMRAQAILALPPAAAQEAWLDARVLRDRLEVESVPSLRLLLALALGPADSQAHAALVALSALDTVTGAQAAGELASGWAPALARLHALQTHAAPLLRASVARQLARVPDQCAGVAPLLADAAWTVRLAAAGSALHCL